MTENADCAGKPAGPQPPDADPYTRFLGFREADVGGEPCYLLDFRQEHLGNPLIRTFHGGVLASFGEMVAALHLTRQRGLEVPPECVTMTFDYLRPSFAGTVVAVPHIVRSGRRITTVSTQLKQDGKLVCIGRFLFAVAEGRPSDADAS